MSDIPELEQRLRALATAPGDGNWEDVLRRARGGLTPHNFHRRRLALALALAAGVVVAVSLAAVFLVHGASHAAKGPGGPMGAVTVSPPDGSNPWGEHGRQISIDELRAEAPYIPLPNSDVANDGSVGTVWVWDHTSDATVPKNHVAAAVYYPSSGIKVLWTRGGLDYTGSESRMIDGVRALLVPRDVPRVGPTGAHVSHGLLSWLDLPVGADEVLSLEGAVPEDTLIELAATLSPSPGDVAQAAEAPDDPLSVTYSRTDGALTSIAVTVSPHTASASAELVVFGGPRDSPGTVVYQQPVPLSAPSAAASEQRPTWSGTLSPSDWKGGCQAGWRYTVDVVAVGPGTSLADVVAHPENWGHNGDAEIDGARLLGGCGPSGG